MSSKRNPNLVTAQILDICADGANKTQVIYRANLNSAMGTQYLNDLTESGFIEAIPDGSRFIYKTTPKGLALQEKLGQYQRTMDLLLSHAYNMQ
ncbi:MAG: winged helix-turn-helix domain-containing protein [Methanotrichaceae archaeon]